MTVMPSLREQVGPTIRRVRLEREQNLKELAGDAGVSYQGLSNIELGTKNTTVDTLDRIFDALGVEPVLALEEDRDLQFIRSTWNMLDESAKHALLVAVENARARYLRDRDAEAV